MKIDWNLIRVLLARIEDESLDEFIEDADSADQGKDGKVIAQHIRLLIDGGYIQDSAVLSLKGFDLLALLRSAPLWNTVKRISKEKGVEISFQTISFLTALALKSMQ